jgi:hypothetical protein
MAIDVGALSPFLDVLVESLDRPGLSILQVSLRKAVLSGTCCSRLRMLLENAVARSPVGVRGGQQQVSRLW